MEAYKHILNEAQGVQLEEEEIEGDTTNDSISEPTMEEVKQIFNESKNGKEPGKHKINTELCEEIRCVNEYTSRY